MKALVPGHKSETLKMQIWDQALAQRHHVTRSPQVCPAEALGCFQLELSVVGFEEGPSMGTAVFRLQRLLDALGSRLWVIGQGPVKDIPRDLSLNFRPNPWSNYRGLVWKTFK